MYTLLANCDWSNFSYSAPITDTIFIVYNLLRWKIVIWATLVTLTPATDTTFVMYQSHFVGFELTISPLLWQKEVLIEL